MPRHSIAGLCVASVIAGGAQSPAQDLPRGSYLLEHCSANNDASDQECFTRIFVVMKMAEAGIPGFAYCGPHAFDLYKLREKVLQVLRGDPSRLQKAYTKSVLIAANQLYPCHGRR
jgi:hypothetical protein